MLLLTECAANRQLCDGSSAANRKLPSVDWLTISHTQRELRLALACVSRSAWEVDGPTSGARVTSIFSTFSLVNHEPITGIVYN